MSDPKTHVESLISKAAAADKPDDAMKLSQAALNAANAMCALKTAASTQP